MLQPTNRLTLIDAMRPPPGFRFESAVAVTFTLDLRALLAAPAAFALAGSENRTDGDGQHEPIELLHAVRSHAGKITVFCQVGEIALPPSRRVFAFLERAVVPVRAALEGIVHPKVWALRYEAMEEPEAGEVPERRLRVLFASRNLTFDASWDTLVRLDEAAAGPGASLAAVGDLFDGLMSIAEGLAADHVERIGSMVAALRKATFALPLGVDELHVHVLGLARTPSPLPISADRSLIISPFLSDDFFASVHTTSVDELVSRPESLDLLKAGSLERVHSVYAFDDGSAPDLSAAEHLSPRDPGRPMVGLHAKVYAFEEAGRARLFLGSANATGPAFTSNVEALVELVGPTTVLGIDKLCNGSSEEPGLRMLFNTYAGPRTADGEPEAGNLDAARRKVARLSIEGKVEESGAGWAVTYRSNQPVPAVGDAAIHCWPLASAGNRRRVEPGEPLDVRFETSLEAISGFLAFEIADDLGSVTQFVVPVPLAGVPAHRERLLLRALVGNAERFLRYLLALLDEDAQQAELLDVIDRATSDAAADETGALNLPVLEKLLRTLRRDPAKLAGLHPLVADLADDDALPPGFAELWTAIFDAGIAGAASR
jgi:hypothetical protein